MKLAFIFVEFVFEVINEKKSSVPNAQYENTK